MVARIATTACETARYACSNDTTPDGPLRWIGHKSFATDPTLGITRFTCFNALQAILHQAIYGPQIGTSPPLKI